MKDLKWIVLESGVTLLQDLDTFKFGFDEQKTYDERDGNDEYFPSLEVIEINSGIYPLSIENINRFFQSSKFISQLESVRNESLIICHLDCALEMNLKLSKLYKTFDVLHWLLIKKCMLVDIRIQFQFYAENIVLEQLKNKYWSYFNKKRMEKEYRQPVLSEKQKKYCESMTSPIVTIECDGWNTRIRVANTSVRSLHRPGQ